MSSFNEIYNILNELHTAMNNIPEGTLQYSNTGQEYDAILFEYGTLREYTEYIKETGGLSSVMKDAKFVYIHSHNLEHRPWLVELLKDDVPLKEV